MPVFYSPVPQNLRPGLGQVGGHAFNQNQTTDSSDFNRDQEDKSGELVSHLPLQMLLYFNLFYFPCWWLSAVCMLCLKYPYLPGYYQALAVTGMSLLSVCEVLRLYLGYAGNLGEKVPELAGFWLVSVLFQLPILLFFFSDEGLLILPLERAVHGIYLLFLLPEILTSLLALRDMSRKLTMQFHLRQFGALETVRPAGTSPVHGPLYSRSPAGVAPYSRPPANSSNSHLR